MQKFDFNDSKSNLINLIFVSAPFPRSVYNLVTVDVGQIFIMLSTGVKCGYHHHHHLSVQINF